MIQNSTPAIADRPLRILAVDDDPIMRELAHEWLAMAGNELFLAANGHEALQIALEHHFDLILLDLEMPLMDGFDVLSELRSDARHVEVPVVVATSRRDTYAIDEAYRRGATSFAIKPLIWPLLVRQLRYVVNSERMKRGITAMHAAMS